jgi:hypothetical protein
MSTNTSESIHLTAGAMLEYNKLTKPEIREIIKNESKEIAKGMEYALRLQGFFSALPLNTAFKIENITLDNGQVLGQITIDRKNWKDFKKVLFHRMGQLPRVIGDLTKATRKTQPFTGANRPVKYKEAALNFLRAAKLGPCVHVEFVRREDKAGNPAFIVDKDSVRVVSDCVLQQYLYTLDTASPMHGIFPASLFPSAVSLNAYYSRGIISYANTGVYSATPEMRQYLKGELEQLIKSQAEEAMASARAMGGSLTLTNEIDQHVRSIVDPTINRGQRHQYTIDINGKEFKFTLFNPNGFIFADLSKLSSILTESYKIPDLTTGTGLTLNQDIVRAYADLIPGITDDVSRAYYVVLSSLRNTMKSALTHKNNLLTKDKNEAKNTGNLTPAGTPPPGAKFAPPRANLPPPIVAPSKNIVPSAKSTIPGVVTAAQTFQAPVVATTQNQVNFMRHPSGQEPISPVRSPAQEGVTQNPVNFMRHPSGQEPTSPVRSPGQEEVTPVATIPTPVNFMRHPSGQEPISPVRSPGQEGVVTPVATTQTPQQNKS